MRSGGMFRVAKVDADKQRSLVEVLGVAAFPSIFGLKNGIIIDNFVGILPQDEVRVPAIFPQYYRRITVRFISGYQSIATMTPQGYCRLCPTSIAFPSIAGLKKDMIVHKFVGILSQDEVAVTTV